MPSDNRGYTLAELVVVMMIFSVVMALISISFSSIARNSSVIVRGVETDIGGLIGLELLRSDLEAAGMGLPWSLPKGVTYKETALGEIVQDYPGTNASEFNDNPPEPPRAFNAGDRVGYNGSDYLVLKGSAVGMSRTSRRWGYLNYSSNGTIVMESKSGMEFEEKSGDRAIVLRSAVGSGGATRELVTAATGSSAFTLVYDGPLDAAFMPRSRLDSYLVYGVAPEARDKDKHHILLSFPYNRADYYINPDTPRAASCAPHTGTLYKTTFNQSGGQSGYPILDCVADFQVVFVVEDEDGLGELTCLLGPEDDPHNYHDAAYLRRSLKEVRLYVMAQQGTMDRRYNFPMKNAAQVISVGDRHWTRAEFLSNGWEHYRWKVYSIVVQPKNL